MRFTLTATKDGGEYGFSGAGPESPEADAWTLDMLTAMREGLEANGFDVDIVTTHTTEVRL